jgi:hypothetical protein
VGGGVDEDSPLSGGRVVGPGQRNGVGALRLAVRVQLGDGCHRGRRPEDLHDHVLVVERYAADAQRMEPPATTGAATSCIQRWLSRRLIETRCIRDPFMSGDRRWTVGNFL